MTLDEIRAAYADMTPDERRAVLPAWYESGYDPSYPEWPHLYGDEDDTGLGELIASEMVIFEDKLPPQRRRSGLVWVKRAADIQRLIEACQMIYVPAYRDWLARNAPEGSRWRPWRTLGKNDTAPKYDYSEFRRMGEEVLRRAYKYVGFDEVPLWHEIFELDHEKAIDPVTARRPSKDGIIQHGLGIFRDRPIGVAPMRAVYALIKRFYVAELGMRAFRPEFPFDEDVAEKRGKRTHVTTPDAARGAVIRRDDMNSAAKFLSLVLKEVDEHFDARQAGLVARAFYKQT